MQHLWQLCTKSLCTRKIRALLTMLGVVFGVGMVLSIAITYETAESRLRDLLSQHYGRAQITLLPRYGTHFEEKHLTEIKGVQAVNVVSPRACTWTTATVAKRNRPFYLIAVQPDRESAVERYPVSAGVPLTEAKVERPLLLREELSRKYKIRIGSKVTLSSPEGSWEFVVVGTFRHVGAGFAIPFSTGVTTFPSFHLLDKAARVSEIDIKLKDDADPQAVAHTLEQKLGVAALVELPDTRPEAVRKNLRVARVTARLISATTLFVGVFIIFNTISMTVAERQREIGILRAIGATRGQVFRLVLTESLIIGALGAALGVLLGIVVARIAIEIFFFRKEFELSASAIVMSAGAGMFTAFIAGLWPAWRAARVSPIEASLPYRRPRGPAAALGPWPLGIVSVILALGLVHAPIPSAPKVLLCATVGMFLLFLGMTLVAPVLLAPISKALTVLLTPVTWLLEVFLHSCETALHTIARSMRNRLYAVEKMRRLTNALENLPRRAKQTITAILPGRSSPFVLLRQTIPNAARAALAKKAEPRLATTALARANLLRAPRRAALTACALMVGVGFIIDLSGDMRSVINDFQRSLQALAETDACVLPFKAGAGNPKAAWFEIPEVSHVTGVGMLLVDSPGVKATSFFATGKIVLCGIEPQNFRRLVSLTFEQGQPQKSFEALARGGSVLISADLARVSGIGLGDRIPLSTPQGIAQPVVAGVVRDPRLAVFTDWRDWRDWRGLVGSFAVLCSLQDLRQLYRADSPNLLLLKFNEQYDFKTTLKKVRGIAWRNGCRSHPLARHKEWIFRDAWKTFRVVNGVLFTAVVIAALGVVNTMTVNVIERTREIGVLRALGADRIQIATMVLSEAIMVGLVGALLGVAAGMLLMHASLVLNREVIGLDTRMLIPSKEIILAVAGAVVVSVLAGIYPAYRSASANIVKAVQME